MIRVLRLLLSTLLAAALVAPAAYAQEPEPGVTIDPDSPAAKEYSFPVDSARKAAQGKTKRKSSSSSSDKKTPLFGEGVKPSGSGSGAGSGSSGSGDSGTGSTTPSSGSTSSSKPKSSTSGKTTTSSDADQERGSTDDQATTATAPSGEDPPGPAPQDVAQIAAQANQPASGGGLGPALIIGAIGLAVLLAGGLAGLAMRRRGPSAGP